MISERSRFHEQYLDKHKDVYILYELLLKHLKEKARTVKKKELCTIIGGYFYISPDMVTRVLNRMIKKGYKPHPCDVKDFKLNVLNLEKIISEQ